MKGSFPVTIPCKFFLYDIIARRDQGTAFETPSEKWNNGVTDEGNATNDTLPGTLPFNSREFTQFYKVLKVTSGLLSPGQCHTHKFKFNPFKSIWDQISQNSYVMKGLTHYQMLVIHGIPANDDTTDTLVGIGSAKVNVVVSKTYKYTYVDNPQAAIKQLDQQGTITTESIINEDTDAVSPPRS